MKKLIIRLLVFLGIFITLSVIITYSSIQNAKKSSGISSVNDIHNSKVNNLNEKKIEIYSKCNEGIDLYGTYAENDLLVKELNEKYNGIEIKIPQIEGLKDNNIQNKINKDIYSRVYEVLNQEPNIKNANYYTYGNFANIISISFIIYDSKLGIRRICLNYNLKDGERLKLEDIFINDADILEVVKDATLDMMLYNLKYNYTDENDITSVNENEFYKFIRGYMNSEDKQFILSPAEVRFFYDGVIASINMNTIADKISIYSKYLTEESLYVQNNIGNKDIFTCIDLKMDIYKGNPYLEENFWYDVTGETDYYSYEINEEKYNKFYEFKSNIYNELDEKVVEYREKAKTNRDKFYVLISHPYVSICEVNDDENIHEKSNMIIVSKRYEIIEMPMDIYKKEYKYKLIDAYRNDYFDVYSDGQWRNWWEPGKNVITENYIKLYNYITNEELIKIEDVFYENSGYIEFIKLKTKEKLLKQYNYTEEEIENLLKDIKYELKGEYIEVTISEIEEFQIKIFISEFDINMLKHVDK